MKKVSSAILAVMLLFCFLACTAFAVEPRWTNTASISPNISSSTYYASVQGVVGTTKIACTLVLSQKGLFGTYSEVARTSSTYYGNPHTFTGSYAVSSGKTYKIDVTAVVTSNGTSETATSSFVKSF